jgi:arsenate reductase (thioredoxin)
MTAYLSIRCKTLRILPPVGLRMKHKILFVCRGNSGRSQMAEGFYNHRSGEGRAVSAGIEPDKEIHPWTVQLMKETGIDVSGQKPKKLTGELMEEADRIVLLAPELLSDIPEHYLTKIEVWKIKPLAGKSIEKVREIREEINDKVKQLLVNK